MEILAIIGLIVLILAIFAGGGSWDGCLMELGESLNYSSPVGILQNTIRRKPKIL